jgi:hypothetical protein
MSLEFKPLVRNSEPSFRPNWITYIKPIALHIKAEVMRLVYDAGSEKSLPALPAPKHAKPNARGAFFSSLLSNFSTLGTPSRTTSPLPTAPVEEVDPLTVYQTNMVLSIFSADVNVRLDKKLAAELHRSTKKNPPSKMRYELIYVSEE